MSPFWLNFFYGLGAGVPALFCGIGLYSLIKKTKERRAIKKAIRQGRFLTPIDPRDYNNQAWSSYIDVSKTEEDLNRINIKIFKKSENSDMMKDFVVRVQTYVQDAKKKGKTEEEISAEMKDNGYSEELIKKIFGEKPLW